MPMRLTMPEVSTPAFSTERTVPTLDLCQTPQATQSRVNPRRFRKTYRLTDQLTLWLIEWKLDNAGPSQPIDADTDDEEDDDDVPHVGTHPSFMELPEAPFVRLVEPTPGSPIPSSRPISIRQTVAPRQIPEKRGRLNFELDNRAKAAWRSRKPANSKEHLMPCNVKVTYAVQVHMNCQKGIIDWL